MADKKISELSAASAAAATQILEVTTDPSGTPVSEKLTVQQVADFLRTLAQTLTNKSIDSASNTITLAASTITSGSLATARGGWGADISGQSGVPNFAAGTPSWITLGTGISALLAANAPAGDMVGTTASQTLTNKALTSPTLTTPVLGVATATSVAASGFLSVSGGAAVASAGALRLANNIGCNFRKADNSGDQVLWYSTSGNDISLGESTNVGGTYVQSALQVVARAPSHILQSTGGTAFLTVTASAITANVAIVEKESAMGALAIDWALANGFTKSLASGGNTITFSNDTTGQTIKVLLVTHASGSTVTWPAGVKWSNGGAEPTQTVTAGAIDIYTLTKINGTVYGVHQTNFA